MKIRKPLAAALATATMAALAVRWCVDGFRGH